MARHPFFPQVTGTHVAFEEPPAFRRFTKSLVEMAVVTGILLRLYRALTLTRGPNESLLYLGIAFGIGLVLLFGMVTLHLGNYTLRRWLWRAPTFALVEAAAESVTSLALIALHREPMGSSRAAFSDWLAMSWGTVLWRVVAVVAFAAVLAGVVRIILMNPRGRAVDDAPGDEGAEAT